MKIGLHVPNFAWQGGPDAMADHLASVAEAAEVAGFDQITRQGSHRFRVAPACKLQRDITRAHGYDFAIIRLRLRRNRPPRMMS